MLAPMVSVFALPVIAIGVGSKHAVPTAIAIVAALLPWALVVGYAIGDSGFSPVATGSTLRVMSVDGDQGNASAADIVQVARAYSADVVVVTGLSSGLAHDLTVAGLDSLASAQWVQIPAGSTDGAGLWSRLKVVDLQPMRELSQPGVKGVIGSGADQIAITVAHIGAEPLQRSPSWRSDLTQLTDQTSTAGRGFIIGGLGATPWQPAFRKLTGAGWRDAADIVGRGLRPTWPSWSPLPIAPLDHVLVTKDLGVGGADTTNIAGTDHRALIVTLIEPRSGD
jgi:endonuclease/exonuclease/phosphatase (EEP) superfamily protein YafD